MTDRRIVLSPLLQTRCLPLATRATVVYPASFFEQYTPTSANDMVTRIPGITLGRDNNHRGGRGLGTSGDLLINGKRVAGKDNSTSSQLTRIASDQVERIEIIGGSSGEMDVRGSFSYGGQAGALNYLFNLEVDPRYNGFQRTEYNYLPDRSLSEIVLEDSDRDQSAVQASMNPGDDFARDRLQFNALKQRSSAFRRSGGPGDTAGNRGFLQRGRWAEDRPEDSYHFLIGLMPSPATHPGQGRHPTGPAESPAGPTCHPGEIIEC